VTRSLALLLALLVSIGTGSRAFAEAIPHETEAPFVDVLTFGVGEEIFERWGHTAICLRYHQPENGPICFNYGVTDFDSGAAMVWSFLRGAQEFWVEASPRDAMVSIYADEDREIWEQTLPLDQTQARAIEKRLWSDVDEKNRFYVYDHFTDNCTTRIRDMIDDALGGKLRTRSTGEFPLTYRQVGAEGLTEHPVLTQVTDFLLGRTLDDHPTVWQAMFHPHVLRSQLQMQLGVEPVVLRARSAPLPEPTSTSRLPLLIVAIVLALLLVLATWRGRFERAALVTASLYLGLWGLVIYALAMLSTVDAVRWNEAVVVLMPLDLALPLMSPPLRRRYAQLRVLGLLAVSILCGIGVLHQPLGIPLLTAIMPLAVIAFGDRFARR
jgi:hypothetical protein